MCSDVCMESDVIHQLGMEASDCSCLDLSTDNGNWCQHNTGRLLCSQMGYCGVWECRIDDFMCPRYEFNKKQIFMKGYGSCIRPKGHKGAVEAMVAAGEGGAWGKLSRRSMTPGYWVKHLSQYLAIIVCTCIAVLLV